MIPVARLILYKFRYILKIFWTCYVSRSDFIDVVPAAQNADFASVTDESGYLEHSLVPHYRNITGIGL